MCCGSSGASGIAGGMGGDLMDEAISIQQDPIQGYGGGALPCTTCSNPKPYTYAVKHLGGLGAIQSFWTHPNALIYAAIGGVAGYAAKRKSGALIGAVLGLIGGYALGHMRYGTEPVPAPYPVGYMYVPGYGEVPAVRAASKEECGSGTFWVGPANPGDPGYCVRST